MRDRWRNQPAVLMDLELLLRELTEAKRLLALERSRAREVLAIRGVPRGD